MLLANTGEASAVVADSLFLAINKKDCSKKKKCYLDAPAFPKAAQLVESKWCLTSEWECVSRHPA